MSAFFHRNWDFLVASANAGVASIATLSFKLDTMQLVTLFFVTIPVGVWSWFRLIDYLKARYASKHARIPNSSESV